MVVTLGGYPIMPAGGKSLHRYPFITITASDPNNIFIPSMFLFDVHARFCNSLRSLQIQEQMDKGWPQESIFSKTVPNPFRHIPHLCSRISDHYGNGCPNRFEF